MLAVVKETGLYKFVITATHQKAGYFMCCCLVKGALHETPELLG